MKNIESGGGSFSVLENNADVQTPVMRFSRSGERLGNEHAAQVLLVVSGHIALSAIRKNRR